MRTLRALALLLALVALAPLAHAQQAVLDNCMVVSGDTSYTPGTSRPCTQDAAGRTKVNATSSAVGDVSSDGSVTSAADLVASTSTGGYKSFNFHFTSVGSGNSVRPQTSNDGTNWLDAICSQATNLNAPATSGAFAIATSVTYSCSTPLRFFKLPVSTYGSGTVTVKGTFRDHRPEGTANVVAQADNLIVNASATSAAALFVQETTPYESVIWSYTSIGSGNSVTPEVSPDNSNWYAIVSNQLGTSNAALQTAGTLSTTALYQAPTAMKYFRLRVSTYGSGTVTVNANFRKSLWPSFMKVAGPNSSDVQVGGSGSIASSAADSGSPVKTGCKYNLTAVADFADGDRADCQASNDGSLQVAGSRGGGSDSSGTITSGGTAQDIVGADSDRKYLMCQNIDTTIVEDLWIRVNATAAVNTAGSFRLQPGASFTLEGTWISTARVSGIAATTGHKFSCLVN